MTFNRSGTVISVEKVDGFGKMPGLWVGNNREQLKVASFGNEKKAEIFCKYLEFVSGITDDLPMEEEA